MSWRKLLPIASFVCCVAVAELARGEGTLNEEGQPYVSQLLRATSGSDIAYKGTDACKQCHGGGLSESDRSRGLDRHVLKTESKVWNDADHHRDAYKALTLDGGRGQRIGKLLNAKVTEWETGCIQCHSPLTKAVASDSDIAAVNCEVC